MWKWSLNWGQITPRIVVGSCPMTPEDLARIRDGAAASAVLSLQHDDCLAYWKIDADAMHEAAAEIGLAAARRPIRDFDIADMRRHLPEAASMLADLLDSGHRAYVHCTAGLGRAPLVVLAYLIWGEQRSREDAIGRLLHGRPDAVPAWEAVNGAEEDLEARFRDEIEKRAHAIYRSGENRDPLKDWRQAKSDVLRKVLHRFPGAEKDATVRSGDDEMYPGTGKPLASPVDAPDP